MTSKVKNVLADQARLFAGWLSAMNRRKFKSPTLPKMGRIGHPEKPNQSLDVDILEWYHRFINACRKKIPERAGHSAVVHAKERHKEYITK